MNVKNYAPSTFIDIKGCKIVNVDSKGNAQTHDSYEDDEIIDADYIELSDNGSSVKQTSTPIKVKSLRPYLDMLLPYIRNGRCWYGVAKALMEKGYVAQNDFEGACILIDQEYKNGGLTDKQRTNPRDLRSLCALSLRKEITLWDKEDQALGESFSSHLTIALRALQIIPKSTDLEA